MSFVYLKEELTFAFAFEVTWEYVEKKTWHNNGEVRTNGLKH